MTVGGKISSSSCSKLQRMPSIQMPPHNLVSVGSPRALTAREPSCFEQIDTSANDDVRMLRHLLEAERRKRDTDVEKLQKDLDSQQNVITEVVQQLIHLQAAVEEQRKLSLQGSERGQQQERPAEWWEEKPEQNADRLRALEAFIGDACQQHFEAALECCIGDLRRGTAESSEAVASAKNASTSHDITQDETCETKDAFVTTMDLGMLLNMEREARYEGLAELRQSLSKELNDGFRITEQKMEVFRAPVEAMARVVEMKCSRTSSEVTQIWDAVQQLQQGDRILSLGDSPSFSSLGSSGVACEDHVLNSVGFKIPADFCGPSRGGSASTALGGSDGDGRSSASNLWEAESSCGSQANFDAHFDLIMTEVSATMKEVTGRT
jgi:hypothetical protein